MTRQRRIAKLLIAAISAIGLAWACGFDDSLREYLNAQFWLPFAKPARDFAGSGSAGVQGAPYAGMTAGGGGSPLERLRDAYQEIANPEGIDVFDRAKLHAALAAARSQPSLTPKQREEVELIDAKIDLRSAGWPASPEFLGGAQKKLRAFVATAHTPEYLSEARGWIAHIHYVLGEQEKAGKIYLDELNRAGSALSRETLVNSLRMTYGYDGGSRLLQDLELYFDTPEHAAFAVSLATNPRWNRERERDPFELSPVTEAPPYERISSLLVKHANLFRTEQGSQILANLGMRTALRAGDPRAALAIARRVPARARVRRDPDFLWMLGSAHFLTRQYKSAEMPLRQLFGLRAAFFSQRAAAAYGLCGVYQKTGNAVEQIRMALWLRAETKRREPYFSGYSNIRDGSVYWAHSGWDLALLLDSEAPVEALRSFIETYPSAGEIRLVRYALAVRLARSDEYDEAATLYAAAGSPRRAVRMRRLAELYCDAARADLSQPEELDAKYELARFLADHPEGIYFNDTLWRGLQRYALSASTESRVTAAERRALIARERMLKDEQEERWRAYLLLREVIAKAGESARGREARKLALRCLRMIHTDRFGREEEIRAADVALSRVK